MAFFQQASNLHSVWDSGILTALGYDNNLNQQQQLLQAISSQQGYLWQQNTVIDWANESAAITMDIYAHYQPQMQIGDNYVLQYQSTLEMRIQQAAVRLALVLDQIFNYRP